MTRRTAFLGRSLPTRGAQNQVQATLTDGVLVINASRNADHVDVDLSENGQQILVLSDHRQIGSFNLASVSRVEFNGWAGDDRIAIVKEVSLPTILNGGAGNDTLSGGGGTNILLGQPGDDKLWGSVNRDILIGGEGSDRLQAGSDDDLLIGGATLYDNNVPALLQILAEWASADHTLSGSPISGPARGVCRNSIPRQCLTTAPPTRCTVTRASTGSSLDLTTDFLNRQPVEELN